MSPRSNLTREIVVQAAADILNAEGLDALSLHYLAEKLDIRTPSLYNHVDGLPGLMQELSILNAHNLADHLNEAAVGQSGPGLVMSVMKAYRTYIKEFTGLYMSTLRVSGLREDADPRLRQEEARSLKIAMAVMAAFGLQGEDALHAVRGLRSLVHGFATLEVSGGFGMPLELDESFTRLVHVFIAGIQKRSNKKR